MKIKSTLQEINISHLGKRKIIFKMPFLMGYVTSQMFPGGYLKAAPRSNPWFSYLRLPPKPIHLLHHKGHGSAGHPQQPQRFGNQTCNPRLPWWTTTTPSVSGLTCFGLGPKVWDFNQIPGSLGHFRGSQISKASGPKPPINHYLINFKQNSKYKHWVRGIDPTLCFSILAL